MTEFEVAFSFGGLVMIEKSTMATLLGLTLSTFAVCSALPSKYTGFNTLNLFFVIIYSFIC